MIYEIHFTPRAERDITPWPAKHQAQILQDIHTLQTFTRPDGKRIKQIRGSIVRPLYRLRAGDYRILFTVKGKDVGVLRIVHRRDLERAIGSLR